ncbi:MAG: divalent-cation tolerance protein CutA [Chthoniobacterales bacterium]|nr:divalent-cation tolerance protein CutA [Chthoniobacterales bacterium]
MIRIVLSTFADADSAARIVRTLVAEKLAACGTLIPGARSIYAWKGTVEDSPEVLVIFKIASANEQNFFLRLKALHPYETPEIVSLSPTLWEESYGRWVAGGE